MKGETHVLRMHTLAVVCTTSAGGPPRQGEGADEPPGSPGRGAPRFAVKIEKAYVFDAPEGKVMLADLFDGRSQLLIKHSMMGLGATGQCVGCSFATFGRDGEEFLSAYRFLDVMPKGRDENGPYHSLADWARSRNMYGKGGMVEANGWYHVPSCACAVHR
jgi:hypothetical protein